MFRLQMALVLLLAGLPAAAQDNEQFSFGGDRFQAGRSVTQSSPVTGDVFLFGENPTASASTGGSAHMIGRRVAISGGVGVNVYAAGQQVTVSAPVQGNITAFGQDVIVSSTVGGNIRAMGQDVTIDADVAGSVMLGGETVTLNAAVGGDVSLSGDKIVFGDGARIGGQLDVYHADPDGLDIPASVIDGARITRHVLEGDENWAEHGGVAIKPTFWTKAKGFFGFTIAVAVAATILAALFPNFMAGARSAALARPVRTVWMGFLALSATAGSLVMVALTGIGLLLVPVTVFLTILLWFLGYVIGAFVLGVGLIKAVGRGVPEDLFDRAIAALVGAIALGLLAMVPFLGWWIVLALVWLGAGAVIIRMFRPSFYAAIPE